MACKTDVKSRIMDFGDQFLKCRNVITDPDCPIGGSGNSPDCTIINGPLTIQNSTGIILSESTSGSGSNKVRTVSIGTKDHGIIEYDSTRIYHIDDLCSYIDPNTNSLGFYKCLDNNVDHPPTESTYWKKIEIGEGLDDLQKGKYIDILKQGTYTTISVNQEGSDKLDNLKGLAYLDKVSPEQVSTTEVGSAGQVLGLGDDGEFTYIESGGGGTPIRFSEGTVLDQAGTYHDIAVEFTPPLLIDQLDSGIIVLFTVDKPNYENSLLSIGASKPGNSRKSILKSTSSGVVEIAAGDLKPDGTIYTCVFNKKVQESSGGAWLLLNHIY